MKKRLDILIAESKSVSRTKAQALIMAGQVSIDGIVVDKPGVLVEDSKPVAIKELYPYVSRGASKIEKAFLDFHLDFQGKTILDIGSSTGGFTDFVLQHGAKRVFAVDVGRGQLAQKLREDKRVTVMEQTDFRNIDKLPEKIDYFLCDVSFISLHQILPHILDIQDKDIRVIALIKPQFEAGVKEVTRGKGVIKSEQVRNEIVEEIKEFAQKIGLETQGLIESPILGAKGNKEFLIYLRK